MRKSKLIIATACMTAFCYNASADIAPSGLLDDSSAIVIAKAVKLGGKLYEKNSKYQGGTSAIKGGGGSAARATSLNPNIGKTVKVYWVTEGGYLMYDEEYQAYVGKSSANNGVTMNIRVYFKSDETPSANPTCVKITNIEITDDGVTQYHGDEDINSPTCGWL